MKNLISKEKLFCLAELILEGVIYFVSLAISVIFHIYVGLCAIIIGVPLLWLLCNNRYEDHGKERRKIFMIIWILSNAVFLDVGGRDMMVHSNILTAHEVFLIPSVLSKWSEFLDLAQEIGMHYFWWLTIPYSLFDFTWVYARYMPIQCGICFASSLGSRWYIELKYSEEMREE